jgi:hypothetical protein
MQSTRRSEVSEAEAVTDKNVAGRLGFKDQDLIQEFGYDEDVDFDLRDGLEDLVGILWWRSDDGDLVDALVDSITTLDDGGVVWVLTPKSGRDGYVPPADIEEAAPTAGLHVTTSPAVSSDWAATRLVARRKK